MASREAVISVNIDPAFARLLARQRNIQIVHMAGDPAELSREDLKAFIRTNVLALIVEAGEALDETQWKPWAADIPDEAVVVGRQRYLSELADVFIFTMNLLLAGNLSMMELAQAVDAKQTKNIQRQLGGYNAKDTKCPGCGRAYDDEGVTCKAKVQTEEGIQHWCADRRWIV